MQSALRRFKAAKLEAPENEAQEAHRHSRVSTILRRVTLVAAVFLLVLAGLGYWVKSTILDSNEFASKVDGVLATPETSQRIGDVLADRMVDSGAVQSRIDASLPSNAQFVSVLLEGQLHDFLARIVTRIASLGSAQDLITAAVRELHELVVSTLEGTRDRLGVKDKSLVLDMNPTIANVYERLGIDRPEGQSTAGTIVLVHNAKALGAASALVRHLNTAVPVLFGISVVGFLVFAFTSRRLDRGFSAVGYAIMIAAVASLLIWRSSVWGTSEFLAATPIAKNIVDSLAYNLRTQSLLLLAAGALIVAVADPRVRGWFTARAASVRRGIESLGPGRTILAGVAGLTLILLVV